MAEPEGKMAEQCIRSGTKYHNKHIFLIILECNPFGPHFSFSPLCSGLRVFRVHLKSFRALNITVSPDVLYENFENHSLKPYHLVVQHDSFYLNDERIFNRTFIFKYVYYGQLLIKITFPGTIGSPLHTSLTLLCCCHEQKT